MNQNAPTLKLLFEKYGFVLPDNGGELKLRSLNIGTEEINICQIFNTPELNQLYESNPNQHYQFESITDQPEMLWSIFENLWFWEETKEIERLLVKRLDIENPHNFLDELYKVNPQAAKILENNAVLINKQKMNERQAEIINFIQKKLKTKNIFGEETVLLECPARIHEWHAKGFNPRIGIPVRLDASTEGQRGITRKIRVPVKKTPNLKQPQEEPQGNVTISISMTGTEAEALVRALEFLGNAPKPAALQNCFIEMPLSLAEALNKHYIFPYTASIETLPADTAEVFEVLEQEQLSRQEWDPRKTSMLDLLEAAYELSSKQA